MNTNREDRRFGIAFSTLALLLFVVASFGRLPMTLQRRHQHPWLRAWLLVNLLAAGLLVYTSHLGGQLVYEHGIGVQQGKQVNPAQGSDTDRHPDRQ